MMSVKSGAIGIVAVLCLACASSAAGGHLALTERLCGEIRDDARFAGLLGQARQALSARVLEESSLRPCLASLLLPLREGQAELRVTSRRVGGVGTEFVLDWGSRRDVVSWDGQGRPSWRCERTR